MATYDLDIELAAIQFTLSALIASHPDKKNFLATFDRLMAEDQIDALGAGGSGAPRALLESVKRYRNHVNRAS